MPLSPEQRLRVEDTIMDLHFTTQKVVDSGKDIHKKLLQVNIEEAIAILEELKDDIVDDEKIHDYKIHIFFPMQVYEIIRIREQEGK